ncbi:hypothetical protein CTAYLR_000411 [Chrysophaeum taylorii]|uniref:VDE lipocalin domain-containing protein n=1 Tax=Chrysophaeum taylorii TaxID=2483200 RepID=A0AAD7UFX3_9STRA|nr:hypothetical protein CTAYLR_000411 [Chrysophaeum taylorii]
MTSGCFLFFLKLCFLCRSAPALSVPPKRCAKVRRHRAAALALGLVALTPSVVRGVEDVAAVGTCVITKCQLPLAKCIGNPKCLANLVCLQTCTNRADETECQIRCGDLFENERVGEFNECAVSQQKCVPQRPDDGAYPVPPASALVSRFDTATFEGRWYISAGLNPVFDAFPCQVHFFTAPSPGRVYGKLNWRIEEPDGEFFTKDTVQRFVQDTSSPGILYNHDNEYLHYEDDWYVLDAQSGEGDDAFVLVYYRGRNDAWDGYGGAVLYTRTPYASPAVNARAEAACRRARLDFADFKVPDNSCPAELRQTKKLLLREKYATKVFLTTEKLLQEEATNLRQNAVSTFTADVREVVQATAKLERAVADYEKQTLAKAEQTLETAERAIVADVVQAEKAIVADVEQAERAIVGTKRPF